MSILLKLIYAINAIAIKKTSRIFVDIVDSKVIRRGLPRWCSG